MPKALARPLVGLNGEIALIVYGTPIAQGSKRAFYVEKLKKAVMTESNKKTAPWRQEVAGAAIDAMVKRGLTQPIPKDVPLEVRCTFYFNRPESLKKSVTEKTTKPDNDKLERAIFDALTGTMFTDDSQIVRNVTEKQFSPMPRVEIYVREYHASQPRLNLK